jgi:hypothetical protein
VLLLAIPTSAFAAVTTIGFDPFVIRTDRTEPVFFAARTQPAVASARIDLNAGGAVSLTTSDGGTTWSGSLTATSLLYGYAPDDIGRNVFGWMRTFDSAGAQLENRAIAIGVIEPSTKRVSVSTAAAGYRATSYVVNLRMPYLSSPSSYDSVKSITSVFYSYFADSYDFVSVVYALPEYAENRTHTITRSDVQGIGVAPKNEDALHGSAGKLLGFTQFPLASWFDGASIGFSHELGHQWVNSVQHPLVQNSGRHWPASEMGHYVMGVTLGGVGGQYWFRYELQPDGSYKFRWEEPRQEFSDIDLYLMGMLDQSAVKPHLVLGNQSQTAGDGYTIAGPLIPFSANDIINTHGPRMPSAANAQKSFRVATIVLTRDRLLTLDEMNWFDLYARRADLRAPTPVSIGVIKSTDNPFYVATRGIGRVYSGIDDNGNYPTMHGLRPESGPAGSQMSIVGGPFQSGVKVYFNGLQAQVLWFTTYEIRVVVPSLLPGKQTVRVTQANGDAVWEQGFTIQ